MNMDWDLEGMARTLGNQQVGVLAMDEQVKAEFISRLMASDTMGPKPVVDLVIDADSDPKGVSFKARVIGNPVDTHFGAWVMDVFADAPLRGTVVLGFNGERWMEGGVRDADVAFNQYTQPTRPVLTVVPRPGR